MNRMEPKESRVSEDEAYLDVESGRRDPKDLSGADLVRVSLRLREEADELILADEHARPQEKAAARDRVRGRAKGRLRTAGLSPADVIQALGEVVESGGSEEPDESLLDDFRLKLEVALEEIERIRSLTGTDETGRCVRLSPEDSGDKGLVLDDPSEPDREAFLLLVELMENIHRSNVKSWRNWLGSLGQWVLDEFGRIYEKSDSPASLMLREIIHIGSYAALEEVDVREYLNLLEEEVGERDRWNKLLDLSLNLLSCIHDARFIAATLRGYLTVEGDIGSYTARLDWLWDATVEVLRRGAVPEPGWQGWDWMENVFFPKWASDCGMTQDTFTGWSYPEDRARADMLEHLGIRVTPSNGSLITLTQAETIRLVSDLLGDGAAFALVGDRTCVRMDPRDGRYGIGYFADKVYEKLEENHCRDPRDVKLLSVGSTVAAVTFGNLIQLADSQRSGRDADEGRIADDLRDEALLVCWDLERRRRIVMGNLEDTESFTRTWLDSQGGYVWFDELKGAFFPYAWEIELVKNDIAHPGILCMVLPAECSNMDEGGHKQPEKLPKWRWDIKYDDAIECPDDSCDYEWSIDSVRPVWLDVDGDLHLMRRPGDARADLKDGDLRLEAGLVTMSQEPEVTDGAKATVAIIAINDGCELREGLLVLLLSRMLAKHGIVTLRSQSNHLDNVVAEAREADYTLLVYDRDADSLAFGLALRRLHELGLRPIVLVADPEGFEFEPSGFADTAYQAIETSLGSHDIGIDELRDALESYLSFPFDMLYFSYDKLAVDVIPDVGADGASRVAGFILAGPKWATEYRQAHASARVDA